MAIQNLKPFTGTVDAPYEWKILVLDVNSQTNKLKADINLKVYVESKILAFYPPFCYNPVILLFRLETELNASPHCITICSLWIHIS